MCGDAEKEDGKEGKGRRVKEKWKVYDVRRRRGEKEEKLCRRRIGGREDRQE